MTLHRSTWQPSPARPPLRLGLVTLLACVPAAILSAQQPRADACGSALIQRPRLESDTAIVTILRTYPILGSLDTLTLKAEEAVRVAGQEVRPVWADPVSVSVPLLVSRLAEDSGLAHATAVLLTRLMSGSSQGASDEQAAAASDLYSSWSLPPDPALMLLGAAWAPPRSRYFAVGALRRYFGDARFFPAAVAALCSLAARAAGVATLASLADTTAAPLVLDSDEWDLLFALTSALGQYYARSPSTHLLREYLPAENPVSADIRKYLGRAW